MNITWSPSIRDMGTFESLGTIGGGGAGGGALCLDRIWKPCLGEEEFEDDDETMIVEDDTRSQLKPRTGNTTTTTTKNRNPLLPPPTTTVSRSSYPDKHTTTNKTSSKSKPSSPSSPSKHRSRKKKPDVIAPEAIFVVSTPPEEDNHGNTANSSSRHRNRNSREKNGIGGYDLQTRSSSRLTGPGKSSKKSKPTRKSTMKTTVDPPAANTRMAGPSTKNGMDHDNLAAGKRNGNDYTRTTQTKDGTMPMAKKEREWKPLSFTLDGTSPSSFSTKKSGFSKSENDNNGGTSSSSSWMSLIPTKKEKKNPGPTSILKNKDEVIAVVKNDPSDSKSTKPSKGDKLERGDTSDDKETPSSVDGQRSSRKSESSQELRLKKTRSLSGLFLSRKSRQSNRTGNNKKGATSSRKDDQTLQEEDDQEPVEDFVEGEEYLVMPAPRFIPDFSRRELKLKEGETHQVVVNKKEAGHQGDSSRLHTTNKPLETTNETCLTSKAKKDLHESKETKTEDCDTMDLDLSNNNEEGPIVDDPDRYAADEKVETMTEEVSHDTDKQSEVEKIAGDDFLQPLFSVGDMLWAVSLDFFEPHRKSKTESPSMGSPTKDDNGKLSGDKDVAVKDAGRNLNVDGLDKYSDTDKRQEIDDSSMEEFIFVDGVQQGWRPMQNGHVITSNVSPRIVPTRRPTHVQQNTTVSTMNQTPAPKGILKNEESTESYDMDEDVIAMEREDRKLAEAALSKLKFASQNEIRDPPTPTKVTDQTFVDPDIPVLGHHHTSSSSDSDVESDFYLADKYSRRPTLSSPSQALKRAQEIARSVSGSVRPGSIAL